VSRPPSLLTSVRRVAPFFAELRWGVLGVVSLAMVTAALSGAEPLLLMHLFDSLSAKEGSTTFVWMVAGLLVLLLVREVLSGLLDCLVWRVRIGASYGMLKATVERLHALPLSYHRKVGVGAIMTKIDRGISGAVAAFSEAAFHLLPAVVYLVVAATIMLRLDLRLGLLVIAFAPVPAIVGALASKEQTARERTLMDRWTKLFSRFNEVLSGILLVKSFAMEDAEKQRFLRGVSEANDIVVRGVATDARTTAVKNAVMAISRVAAMAVGGYLVVHGRMTVGTLIAFVGYVGGLFNPVQAITGLFQTLRRGVVAVETVQSILDANDSLADAPDAVDCGELRGEVELRDLEFGYRESRPPVLRGIDLHVEPGETIALVGPSGSGKSTVVGLLQRLYDPTSGAVLLDGKDLRTLKQRSIRQQIGVVLQEGLLFSDSVRDNIAFGRPGASMEQIEAAAKAAKAHDFIMALPRGYDTEVGERGATLSGGERQRIAIARALLKDPPILILDEATSALDADSEADVSEALSRLCQGRTTFIIAHRLTTVTRADRIVVLRDGVIHEMGTHATLMRRRGYYASIVARQVGGLLQPLADGTDAPALIEAAPAAAE
jgi:ATP-binding cassette, subfamily B, bacterial